MITGHCAISDSSQFLLPFQGSVLQNRDHVACEYAHSVLYWSVVHNCRENQNDCIILLATQEQFAELLKWPTYILVQYPVALPVCCVSLHESNSYLGQYGKHRHTHTHTHTAFWMLGLISQPVWTGYVGADPHPYQEVMTTTTTKPQVLHVARSHFPQATMLHKSHMWVQGKDH